MRYGLILVWMLFLFGVVGHGSGKHRHRASRRQHRDQPARISAAGPRAWISGLLRAAGWIRTISSTTACTGSTRGTTGTRAPGTTGPGNSWTPTAVPLFVLRVPVRYYRQPPAYFHGWRSDAPPRWGDHWGNRGSRVAADGTSGTAAPCLRRPRCHLPAAIFGKRVSAGGSSSRCFEARTTVTSRATRSCSSTTRRSRCKCARGVAAGKAGSAPARASSAAGPGCFQPATATPASGSRGAARTAAANRSWKRSEVRPGAGAFPAARCAGTRAATRGTGPRRATAATGQRRGAAPRCRQGPCPASTAAAAAASGTAATAATASGAAATAGGPAAASAAGTQAERRGQGATRQGAREGTQAGPGTARCER